MRHTRSGARSVVPAACGSEARYAAQAGQTAVRVRRRDEQDRSRFADDARDAGRELYKHRKATVEPVLAQNKLNRGFRRFQRRGRSAVRSEWRLQAAVHNLMKLHSHWIAPTIA
jgi:hypothetical protein